MLAASYGPGLVNIMVFIELDPRTVFQLTRCGIHLKTGLTSQILLFMNNHTLNNILSCCIMEYLYWAKMNLDR